MSGKGRVYPATSVRLLAATNKEPGLGPWGDCWEFVGVKVRGYGQIKHRGRQEYAHRVAYELDRDVYLGRARETKILVLHRCDNRACVRPDHLFLGTAKDNHVDMTSKGRRRLGDQRGERNPLAKITPEDVLKIRNAEDVKAAATAAGISLNWAQTIRRKEAWTHI